MICNHWPDEWSNRYRENGYFPDDPVSLWSFQREAPFLWSEARRQSATSKRTVQIENEAAEHGLRDGIAFPMRSPHGTKAVVSLATKDPLDISKRDEGMLFLASTYFQVAATQMVDRRRPVVLLTAREREILRWSAAGKTAFLAYLGWPKRQYATKSTPSTKSLTSVRLRGCRYRSKE